MLVISREELVLTSIGMLVETQFLGSFLYQEKNKSILSTYKMLRFPLLL